MATAQAILQRFYFRKSFMRCDLITVATASLFIAAKVEENPRKVKDVITVVDYVHKLKKSKGGVKPVPPVLDINSFYFTDTKQEIFDAERYILKELGFATDALSKTPVHKYLYFFLKSLLKGSTKALAQSAWNFANDSYRTVCIVQFPPNVIACACIYLATRVLEYPMPIEPASGEQLPWWKIVGVSWEDLSYVAASILELYQEPFCKEASSWEYIDTVTKDHMFK